MRKPLWWAAVVLLVAIASVATYLWAVDGAPARAPAATAGTAVVGGDGFRIDLDGVRVSGPADVAPRGTRVRARVGAVEISEMAGFATPVGRGVTVELGSGEQPSRPIEVVFDRSSSDGVDAVVASTAGGGEELADVRRSSGHLVVSTDHLSWFQPVAVSTDALADHLRDQVLQAMQVRTPRPSCAARPVADGTWAFGDVADQIVWPCAEVTSDGVSASLTNNTPEAWLVSSDVASPRSPSTTSPTGAALAAAALQFVDRSTTVPLVPGGSVSFDASEVAEPFTMTHRLDPSLSVVSAVVTTLGALVPAKKLENLGRAECFVDLVESSLASGGSPGGDLAGAVVRCVGEVVGRLAGAVIGAIAEVPGTLAAMVDGVVRELTGRAEVDVTLSPVDAPATSDDLAAFAGSWTGQVDQDGEVYSVRITIAPTAGNGRVGTVTYPELDQCGGYLDEAAMRGSGLRVTEHITTRPGRCVAVVDLVLTRQGSDGLLYDAMDGAATGTLRRTDAPDLSPPPD